MPSLKDLKTRINSVKSTQKITSAMKMVAAAKLRRAQDSAERGRPYADRMQQIINSLAGKADPVLGTAASCRQRPGQDASAGGGFG
jgi:F-type H+-transporting ATPase subunit gamma